MAVHEVPLFHLVDDVVNLFGVEQLLDGSLVFADVAVDEVETASDHFQLVNDLLKFERH